MTAPNRPMKPSVQTCQQFLPVEGTIWRLDCVRPPRHAGDHETAAGQKWQIREPGDQPA